MAISGLLARAKLCFSALSIVEGWRPAPLRSGRQGCAALDLCGERVGAILVRDDHLGERTLGAGRILGGILLIGGGDLRLGRQPVVGQAFDLGQLDLVDFMVTAHQYQHELLCLSFTRDQRHRLHRALQVDAEQGRDLAGAGVLLWRN